MSRGFLARGTHPVHQPRGDPRGEDRLPDGGRADGAGDLIPGRILEQVPSSPRLDGPQDVRVRVVSRQDQDVDSGVALADPGGCCDAVDLWHPEIHQDYVGFDPARKGDSLSTVRRFSDDLEVGSSSSMARRPRAVEGSANRGGGPAPGGGGCRQPRGVAGSPDARYPEFPKELKPIAYAHADALEVLRSQGGDVNWTVLSPPPVMHPGQRNGTYRVGTDSLLTDDTGASTSRWRTSPSRSWTSWNGHNSASADSRLSMEAIESDCLHRKRAALPAAGASPRSHRHGRRGRHATHCPRGLELQPRARRDRRRQPTTRTDQEVP